MNARVLKSRCENGLLMSRIVLNSGFMLSMLYVINADDLHGSSMHGKIIILATLVL